MMKFNSEQSGRSMVEMLGVLAIIGVLSVAGIAGYSKAMAKYKTNRVLDQAGMVVTNVRTLYSGQPNYAGATDAILLNGAAEADMIKDNKVVNAFGGEVHLAATDVTTSGGTSLANGGFYLTFEGLTKDACIAIASADWGSSIASGLYKVLVGGNEVGSADANTLPAPLGTVASKCTGTTNTVGWIYR